LRPSGGLPWAQQRLALLLPGLDLRRSAMSVAYDPPTGVPHNALGSTCRHSATLACTRILEMLLAAHGTLVSAAELLEHVWDVNADPFSNIASRTGGVSAEALRE
jgi:hypothetical protein